MPYSHTHTYITQRLSRVPIPPLLFNHPLVSIFPYTCARKNGSLPLFRITLCSSRVTPSCRFVSRSLDQYLTHSLAIRTRTCRPPYHATPPIQNEYTQDAKKGKRQYGTGARVVVRGTTLRETIYSCISRNILDIFIKLQGSKYLSNQEAWYIKNLKNAFAPVWLIFGR